jgi:hypothetical protein
MPVSITITAENPEDLQHEFITTAQAVYGLRLVSKRPSTDVCVQTIEVLSPVDVDPTPGAVREAPAAYRLRGEPAPGNKRRSPAETKQDALVETLCSKSGVATSAFDVMLVASNGSWDDVIQKLELQVSSVSADVDVALDAALDDALKDIEADEKPAPKKKREYSLDDIRNALGKYMEKVGQDEAKQTGPRLIGARMISEVADTDDNIKDVLSRIAVEMEACD